MRPSQYPHQSPPQAQWLSWVSLASQNVAEGHKKPSARWKNAAQTNHRWSKDRRFSLAQIAYRNLSKCGELFAFE
jgi:hypothetical protein